MRNVNTDAKNKHERNKKKISNNENRAKKKSFVKYIP